MPRKISLVIMLLLAAGVYALDMGQVRNEYMKGVQALANNELYDAERSFKTVISIVPEAGNTVLVKYQARSHYFLGDVYFVQKDYENAVKHYRQVVQNYMQEDIYSRSLYKLGRTLVLARKYREAIALLNSYLASYDNSDALGDNALYWIGRSYIGMEDYRLAQDTYRYVLEKYPDTALAYDIRSSLPRLEQLIADQQYREGQHSGLSNELRTLQEQNTKLQQEKLTLEKMSELLLIKQRLLEIKAEKVEILARLKEDREGTK